MSGLEEAALCMIAVGAVILARYTWIKSMKTIRSLLSLLLAVTLVQGAMAADSSEGGYVPTVLITGSNRGIGFEFARQYAAKGWRVIATARSPDSAEDLQELAATYDNVLLEALDVNDLSAVDALSEEYADQPIDVLINNAAISGSPSPKQLFGKIDYEYFDLFMNTNVRGPLKVSEAFAKQLRNSQKKKLVVISSLGGSFTAGKSTAVGTMLYRTSKAAVNMAMVNVADAVRKHGVSVTLLNPGLVDTQGVLTKMNDKMELGLTLTPIEQSVRGMIDVIAAATMDTSGKWYQWSGEEVSF
jgi:NAD(P)-dependent dehydrogenase (short-subunit alcohol dehydrogenase family)